MQILTSSPWAFWVGWLFIGIGICQINAWVGLGLMIISAGLFKAASKQSKENEFVEKAQQAGEELATNIHRSFEGMSTGVLGLLFDLGKNDESVFLQTVDFINKLYSESDLKGVSGVCLVVLKYTDRIEAGDLGDYHRMVFARHAETVHHIAQLMEALGEKAS